MKSQDTGDALQALRAAGVREQPIFCLQNGIANEPDGAAAVSECPWRHGDDARHLHGAGRRGLPRDAEAGTVRYRALSVRSRMRRMRPGRAFDGAEMAGFVHDDVMASKRGKLLLNLGNALEASLGRGNERGDWPEQVRAEAEAVLSAAGLAGTMSAWTCPAARSSCRWARSRARPLRRVHLAEPRAGHGAGRDRLPQRRNRLAGADGAPRRRGTRS
jgi:ketopantoate reductase